MFYIIVIIAILFPFLKLAANKIARTIIYPTFLIPPSPPTDLPLVEFATNDGEKIQAIFIPPKPDQPTILYFHGNAMNVHSITPDIKAIQNDFPGFGIMAIDYRGYGNSTSKSGPSEKGLYEDARSAIAYLHKQTVKPQQAGFNEQDIHAQEKPAIILFGFSLGCGVAVEMAKEMPGIKCVVLQAPIKSIKDMTILPTFFINEKYDNINKIKKFDPDIPVLILHGENDTIVPQSHGKDLFRNSNSNYKKFVSLPIDHNNYQQSVINDYVKKYLISTN